MKMPTYRGNRGNLLQHWVLTELVAVLRKQLQAPDRLCYIDAHAMSPFAIQAKNPGLTAGDFDAVAGHLPGQNSDYEQAWMALRGDQIKYPSSGLFVRHLWQGNLGLVLCEADKDTAIEIDGWLRSLGQDTSWELHRGDWRARFRQEFPRRASAYLISFDPYMFDRHGPPARPNPGNMWPSDLVRAGAAVLDLETVPVILQLSTYSANNGNGQDAVIAGIIPELESVGLEFGARVRADGNMMSMVFTRDVPGIDNARLGDRFEKWIKQAKKPA